MSNEEINCENNIKNNDKDSNKIEEDEKINDSKGDNKISEIENLALKQTVYCSTASCIKEDESNINSNEQNSSDLYILNKSNSQNEQNVINNYNIINIQNENENKNKNENENKNKNENKNENIQLQNNTLNLINPIENLNREFNNININSEVNREQPLYNNSRNNNLSRNEMYSNQSPLINPNIGALSSQQFNAQPNWNIQNTFTRNAILSSFLSQNTTMIMQNLIIEAPDETIEIIVNELSGTYQNIITNKNGNYFCSDLFKYCNQRQRIKILKELSKTISEDCNDKYATHPIQNLIEYSNCEEEYNLILVSFDYNKSLIACIDPNGSFVIQKIIKHIPERYRSKFNLLFISFITFIVKKRFGVVNAKKFVDYTKNEETLNRMMNFIISDFLNIATHQFGNYFIQHILQKWCNMNMGNKIKKEIIRNFRVLFNNKYSSFICDLFLKLANNTEIFQLMNSLNLNIINNTNNNNDKIIMMKIMKSFEQNFVNNLNNNNNFNNQNQMPFPNNNFNNNNNNNNNLLNQNQFPLSLNNFKKKK